MERDIWDALTNIDADLDGCFATELPEEITRTWPFLTLTSHFVTVFINSPWKTADFTVYRSIFVVLGIRCVSDAFSREEGTRFERHCVI